MNCWAQFSFHEFCSIQSIVVRSGTSQHQCYQQALILFCCQNGATKLALHTKGGKPERKQGKNKYRERAKARERERERGGYRKRHRDRERERKREKERERENV